MLVRIDDLMEGALKQMHILRLGNCNGYVNITFITYFLSSCHYLFTACVFGVWGVAAYTKSLSQIDTLQKRAFRFTYIRQVTLIQQVVLKREGLFN